MDIQTALSLLNLETGTYTKKELKKAYKAVSLKFHPDKNPAGSEMMQAINEAWEAVKDLDEATKSEDLNNGYADILNDALNAIIACEGLDIEVCGSWVWVGGNSKEHKEAIKAAGFKWAKKKSLWYYRPDALKASRKGGKTWNMDKIRETHGSQAVKTKMRKSLAA